MSANPKYHSFDTPGKAPSTSTRIATTERIIQHLKGHVRSSLLAELELLILSFCTGIQDATSCADYRCFTSNQTGNTVFLAIAAILQGRSEYFVTANVSVSLATFLSGSLITGQLGHAIGPRNRAWLLACNLFQTALVFSAAAVQIKYGTGLHDTMSLAAIALLGFAGGSQVVQSRSLAATEISTAMATAAWVDLVIDSRLFAIENRPRNRRAGFIVCLFSGALIGGYLRLRFGSAVAVGISALGKAIVTFMFLFNPADVDCCV